MPFYHDYLKIGQIFRLVGDQKDAIKANVEHFVFPNV